jgi:hypothetical protein
MGDSIRTIFEVEFQLLELDRSFVYEVDKELNNRTFDPLEILLTSLEFSKDKSHIIIIGLSLRFKPDLNQFRKDGLSIILYIFEMIKGKSNDFVDTIMSMIILSGLNLDGQAKKGSSQTIEGYLIDEGYSLIENYQQNGIRNVLEDKSKNILGMLLDDPSLITGTPTKELVFKSLSTRVINKYYKISKSKILWENEDLLLAVKYYNINIIIAIFDAGILPSYILVQYLIITAEKYYMKGKINSVEFFFEVLKEAVDRGLKIDKYQAELINSIGGNSIIEVYNEPRWIKYCDSGEKFTQELDDVVYKLEMLGDDKCLALKLAAKLDMDQLIEALVERQESRIRINTSNIGMKVTESMFTNIEKVISQIKLYPDIDSAYYMDHKGKLTAVKYEDFGSVLSRSKDYPKGLIDKIEAKVTLRKKVFGNRKIELQSYENLVTYLYKSDSLLDNINGNVKSKDFLNSKKFNYNKFLDTIYPILLDKIVIVKGDLLNESQQKKIFAWIMNWLKTNDKESYSVVTKAIASNG